MRTLKIFNDPKAFEIAADKTRRRIVHLLRARVLSVSQIADELDMTPQAIYFHIKKMLEVGLIEVAKEERVEHFIEAYYQASAEIFQFNYGEEGSKAYSEARTKEALGALNQIGLMVPMGDETVSRFAVLKGKMNSIYQSCSLDVAEKISQIDGLDSFTKQDAIEIACKISMSDERYRELQKLDEEVRDLLKPQLVDAGK
jgi:DNA-binding transcriptional ArsR family regulator